MKTLMMAVAAILSLAIVAEVWAQGDQRPADFPAQMLKLVPESDPKVEGPAPTIVPELMGKHPRLLFSQEDIAQLKAFAQTPTGQIFAGRLKQYLGSSKPPEKPGFLVDATDGQRQGLWRMPTVALHYVLTGEKQSFDRTVGFMKMLLELPHWETNEVDSGMSSANIMIGAALAYDWLYNDLDPDFREQYRQKLWEHARRQYYLGHLKRGKWIHYWQGDPQNNHRWHRNAGMSLCLLAAYTGEDSQKWMMQQLAEEFKFVMDWLPEDGTSHESPGYMIFGATHLMLGLQAVDRCLGTDHLQSPFVEHLPEFMIQTMTPGLNQRFHYGDQGGTDVGAYNYDVFELKAAGVHKQADLLALMDRRLKSDGVAGNMAWLGLLWYPKDLKAAPIEEAATKHFFPDVGVAVMRDTWEKGGRGAMFKCGPFGGYLLNKFRHQHDMQYINVAHDDPDANSFLLFKNDEFVAESDRYSYNKKSANLNTILINGIGQTVEGRGEGDMWWQPGGDMSKIAVITAKAENGSNYAIEGEAAGSYPANPKGGRRPALQRYRRSFIWVDGRYVLVLDDIRAPQAVDVSWLIQSGAIDASGAEQMRFLLKKGEATCAMAVAATQAMECKVVDSPADNRKKPLGWKQLRLETKASTLRIASVYDMWDKGNLKVALKTDGDNKATVTVSGQGINDSWSWTAAEGQFGPSNIIGKNADGAEIITLNKPEPETRELIMEIGAEQAE